ncbi:global transcription factor group [Corchorus olitorius]|uniref:Global transcription factor group n=1 Tax=Corchorus olitorius TaxID=93759 RepID=A0A1R3KRT8_9ROSI|nr:global transcription factor group [Corchorus olitorius]
MQEPNLLHQDLEALASASEAVTFGGSTWGESQVEGALAGDFADRGESGGVGTEHMYGGFFQWRMRLGDDCLRRI